MLQIREAKRKKLIQKLFRNLAIITLGVKYQEVKLKFKYDDSDLSNRFWFRKKLVEFSPKSVNYRIKDGYNDGYYNGRKEKLDKIIHNNKKNCIRFIMLHEIYHYKQFYFDKKTVSYPKQKRELEADNYAITTLKKEGIKNVR